MRDVRIHTGAIELQVREYEHPGSPVIFQHYGGANLMMWQRAVPYFEGQYRLILVDLRDHGKSDKPQTGDDIDQMAADVAGMMGALQIEKVHLVGSSLGAEVALSLAANYPEKVISLVCDGALTSEYGPYSAWEESEEAFREHVQAQLDGMRGRAEKVFPSISAFLADSRQNLEKHGLWNEYMEAIQVYDVCEVRPGEFVRGWQKQARLNYMTHYFDCRFENYYPRVQCPLLMVTGSETEPADTRAMQGLCELAPKGKLVVVTGWMHPYGWLLHPEAMCQIVLEFLSEGKPFMNTPIATPLVKVAPADNPKYYAIFQQFEHFSNYINFAIGLFTPEIWVDDEAQPTLACFYTAPAYFLWGDPDAKNVTSLLETIPQDRWLVPSSDKWDRHLVTYFGKRLITHPRTSFDASSLRLEHLRSLKTELPAGLRLVPINETHVNDQEGMLYQDLLCKFFTAADFLQQGAGFCLLEDEKIIGFAAANYPIRNQVLEVYIRVDYNDDPRHRHQGLGTQLGVALLEYCLDNGLEPQWDAANDISVRLALKLGYTLRHAWKMYHLQ